MKKKIFLSVFYIGLTGLAVSAQSYKELPPPPPPPPPVMDAPAPPPAPEAPTADLGITEDANCPEPIGSTIINNHGYEISVQVNNGRHMVILKKDNTVTRIKLDTWNSKPKYYEKKYGQLPPPPPPPPPAAPVRKKNNNAV